jgi:hypothetical protein
VAARFGCRSWRSRRHPNCRGRAREHAYMPTQRQGTTCLTPQRPKI